MPYRKQQFANNEINHIILRGIDDNLIFKDLDDYYRGIFSIYEFNNLNPVIIRERRRAISHFKKTYRGRASESFIDKRNRFVDILCFCFMPNHLHLLIKQLEDGGVIKFMQKFGTGYAGYFNKKYQRRGYMFQNRFSSVHIENDEQLKIVFAYIHTNPLSLKYPEWKKIKIENPEEANNFLEKYKWSSYLDCIGIKNFPSVTQREFIVDLMKGKNGCKDFVKYWIEYKGESKKYNDLFLE
jgi:putative transposase